MTKWMVASKYEKGEVPSETAPLQNRVSSIPRSLEYTEGLAPCKRLTSESAEESRKSIVLFLTPAEAPPTGGAAVTGAPRASEGSLEGERVSREP